jgi:glycosyltransferase involved in cell wall biosynthesis
MQYSLVVPIYNDGALSEAFCVEFQKVFQQYLAKQNIEDSVEVIFVNDGSPNDSLTYLEQTAAKFPFVKVLGLSRNFGQHIAVSCGYRHASGQYVGMLNVDMEDHPSEIPKVIDYVKEKQLDLVIGLRKERQDPFFKRVTSVLFNWTLNKLTGQDVPLNLATLRIMSRRFTDAYNNLSEKSRYIPGLESWLGFKQGYLSIEHRHRTEGKSSYNFSRRVKMAMETIISFSDLPLKIIAAIGFGIVLLGFLLIFGLIIAKFVSIDFQAGYLSTISIIVFLGGIQIMVIGMASLYIGRILKEIQNRPLYIVKDKINF